jgi:hypothetical protein
MPDPIKTQALSAFTAAVAAIPGMGQALLNPSTPLARETARFPCAFIEDGPEALSRRNRYGIGDVAITVEIWIEGEASALSGLMDKWQADLVKALSTNAGLLALRREVKPAAGANNEKFYVDERLGMIESRWQLTYMFAWGDPYDPGV